MFTPTSPRKGICADLSKRSRRFPDRASNPICALAQPHFCFYNSAAPLLIYCQPLFIIFDLVGSFAKGEEAFKQAFSPFGHDLRLKLGKTYNIDEISKKGSDMARLSTASSFFASSRCLSWILSIACLLAHAQLVVGRPGTPFAGPTLQKRDTGLSQVFPFPAEAVSNPVHAFKSRVCEL